MKLFICLFTLILAGCATPSFLGGTDITRYTTPELQERNARDPNIGATLPIGSNPSAEYATTSSNRSDSVKALSVILQKTGEAMQQQPVNNNQPKTCRTSKIGRAYHTQCY